MAPEKELEKLIKKREDAGAKHMDSYRNGSATRARTTTYNANVAAMNERIIYLRAEIQANLLAAAG